ncbi:OmpA family protein [Deltaproteobacteria bacterium OttesenSCG-928-K17]|nr:OmpA family protein [Deltaproteobacteria bacterium OttesenSCG-928-K17]
MGLFNKNGPSRLEPDSDHQPQDQAESSPEANEILPGAAELPSPIDSTSDPDYSNEDVLLAMVKNYVAPSQPLPGDQAENHGGHSAPTEMADDYQANQDTPDAIRAPQFSGGLNVSAGSDLDSPLSPQTTESDAPLKNLLADLPPVPDDEELEALRGLIFSREIKAIEAIYGQMADRELRTEAVSQIITEALRRRVLKDNELVGVLKPTVENIVSNSVRNNPKELADNLFPVIGPAIRRSISESIRAMLQDFSRTLEKSFSLTGLKWRMEALRTGKEFSEVVMLKTLEYQIEQVVVIHAETGAPLIHLVNQDAREEVKEKAKDTDQVAAMLTVIQQFVSDSFSHGELTTVDFGDRNIFLARAPQLILACVVWGQPPSNLRIDMQTALELMVMDCADDLADFNGDDKPFARAAHHFEALLVSRFKGENQKLSFRAKLLPLTLIAVMICGFGVWAYNKYDISRLEDMVYETASAPGLVPLRVTPSMFGEWEIVCLKDELAINPETNIVANGLPADRFKIRYLPYVSQDREIVERRLVPIFSDKPNDFYYNYDHLSGNLTLSGQASLTWVLSLYDRLMAVPGVEEIIISDLADTQNEVMLNFDEKRQISLSGSAPVTWTLAVYDKLLAMPGISSVDLSGLTDPNNGVTIRVDDHGAVHLKGSASVAWRDNIKERARALSGIREVDLTEVNDDQSTARIRELIDSINSTVIYFPLNKDMPVPADEEKLNEAVRRMVLLENLVAPMDMAVSLTIYGHADATGSEKHNYELSQARAKTIAAKLYAADSNIPISTYGMGSDFALKEQAQKSTVDQASRKIELRVRLNRKGASVALD